MRRRASVSRRAGLGRPPRRRRRTRRRNRGRRRRGRRSHDGAEIGARGRDERVSRVSAGIAEQEEVGGSTRHDAAGVGDSEEARRRGGDERDQLPGGKAARRGHAQLGQEVEGAGETRVGSEREGAVRGEQARVERPSEHEQVAGRTPDDPGAPFEDPIHVPGRKADRVDEDRVRPERAGGLEPGELRARDVVDPFGEMDDPAARPAAFSGSFRRREDRTAASARASDSTPSAGRRAPGRTGRRTPAATGRDARRAGFRRGGS